MGSDADDPVEVEFRDSPDLDDTILQTLYRISWPGYPELSWRPVLEHSVGCMAAFRRDRLIGFVNIAWDGRMSWRGSAGPLPSRCPWIRLWRSEWRAMGTEKLAGSWYRGPGVRATLLLVLGLGAILVAKKYVGIQDGAVLTSFVVVPALLYVVLRGDLAELRGPGGWAATFVKVARATVSPASEKLDVYEDVQIIAKESMQGLTARVSLLANNLPVIMTMVVGNAYSRVDLQGYLDTLSQLPRFRIVALLDRSGAFVGCISAAELRGIMRSEGLANELLSAVSHGDIAQIFRYPGMLKVVVQSTATNAEALSTMTAHNLGSLAVVGEDNRLRGVIERDQLVSKLVLSLTAGRVHEAT